MVVGLGEIGTTILKLVSKSKIAVGFDINSKLVNKKKLEKYSQLETTFLHICIPYNDKFIKNIISLKNRFSPKGIVIHSTIAPYTTHKLQEQIPIPIIYSATRGVHKRMISDLKRYTKFYSIEENAPNEKWADSVFLRLMKKCHVKTKKMSKPITLELAKIIVDTSYYGWLINYAQLSNIFAIQHNVNYEEMWSFSDEIHKFLGNSPKMFPGFIGGHCVIPNLKLINNHALDQIKEINNEYLKKNPNAKSVVKKHLKS